MKKVFTFIIVLFVVISGCRKSVDFDDLSYNFFVSTNLDQAANFGSYKTFFISDTVINIGGIGKDSLLTGPNAIQLVKVVKDNLIARGYTFAPRTGNPDLGLIMSVIKDINVVVSYYPGWWGGYYGGCYWYYYCYGYYYPWSTVYTYTTGTVILNMYDLKNAPVDHQFKGIWNVTGLGALGSTSTNIQLGVDALNQGFEQSPYVKTN